MKEVDEHKPLAERAPYHVAVGGGAVGAAAQRAARALVALLVARVAHRVVRVPAGRRARARRARAAVRAHAAALHQQSLISSLTTQCANATSVRGAHLNLNN